MAHRALAGTVLLLLTGACVPVPESDPLPSTDIWLVEWNGAGDSPGDPVNLTDREGYDNQPAFLPDGSGFLYASEREDQIDIWLWDFASGAGRPLTRTPENEYSPQPIPADGGFSVVRVEANDDADQRLWRFDADGGNPRLLVEWEDSVEYYGWVDADIVALRLRGEPNELKFADARIGSVERAPVARSVGRAIARVPGSNTLAFVHKVSPEQWWLRQLDLLTREAITVAETPQGSEDFAWTPDGKPLISHGSAIERFVPGEGWLEAADFADAGVGRITRLAVSPDGKRLLFVADRASERVPGDG